jgi:ubiquinone/menaquinone biosynthesis C-methylase UbiE
MSLLENHPNPIIRFQEKNRKRILFKLAQTSKKKVVVDIGCEEGYIAKDFAKKSKLVFGVDIDDDLLKKAAKKGLKNNRWVQSNIHKIKLKDNVADITVCSCVLEHVPKVKNAVDELVRITKPNGHLIINVPNEKWVLFIKRMLRLTRLSFLLGGLSKEQAHGHLYIFNKKNLKRLVNRKDLSVEKIRYDFPFFTNIFVRTKVVKKK